MICSALISQINIIKLHTRATFHYQKTTHWSNPRKLVFLGGQMEKSGNLQYPAMQQVLLPETLSRLRSTIAETSLVVFTSKNVHFGYTKYLCTIYSWLLCLQTVFCECVSVTTQCGMRCSIQQSQAIIAVLQHWLIIIPTTLFCSSNIMGLQHLCIIPPNANYLNSSMVDYNNSRNHYVRNLDL